MPAPQLDKTLEELIESENNKREMVITLGELSDLITKERQEAITTTIERVEKKIIQQVFVVGCASAKREDIGTPKADPNSEYNQGYKDAKNIINKANAQALSTIKQELLGKD